MSDRIAELNQALERKTAENNELINSVKLDGGTIEVSQSLKEAIDKNNSEMRQIKSLLEMAKETSEVERWASETEEKSVASEVYADAPLVEYSYQSVGEQFTDSMGFKSFMQTNPQTGGSMNESILVKDVANISPHGGGGGTGDLAAPSRFRTIQRIPEIITGAERKHRIRDLFPVRKTTMTQIEYFRRIGFTYPTGVTGHGAGANSVLDSGLVPRNAAEVVPQTGSDGDFIDTGITEGVSPQSGLSFVAETAPVRTISHWEAAHRHVLDDEPTLRAIIDNELMYGLRLKEDDQILRGSGQGEELRGILAGNRTAVNGDIIQVYNWSDGETSPVADTKADAIRRALTLAYLAYYEPTGIVMHPSDMEDVELTRSTEGVYLMAANLYMGAKSMIWRVPIIDTPAIPEGVALVGAFGMGATLHDRQMMTIRVSDTHSDFFTRSAMAILAEERLALCVTRPESFVRVNFDNAPS